jgi:hypothetical protein
VGAGFLVLGYPLKLLVKPPRKLFDNGKISQLGRPQKPGFSKKLWSYPRDIDAGFRIGFDYAQPPPRSTTAALNHRRAQPPGFLVKPNNSKQSTVNSGYSSTSLMLVFRSKISLSTRVTIAKRPRTTAAENADCVAYCL